MAHIQAHRLADVPEQGGRRYCSGGLAKVNDRIYWGSKMGTVYQLNEHHNVWLKVAGITFPIGATLTEFEGNLVAVGGRKGIEGSKEVVKWDGRLKQWIKITEMPKGCWGSSVITFANHESLSLVVFGWSCDENAKNVIQAFNKNTNTWHIYSDLNHNAAISSAALGNQVIMVGGSNMCKSVLTFNVNNLFFENHHEENQLKTLPSIPCFNSCVSAVNGVLIAIGGTEETIHGVKFISVIYAFCASENKWKDVGNMPFVCSNTDAITLSQNRVLVVDGSSKKSATITIQDFDANYSNISGRDMYLVHKEGDREHYFEWNSQTLLKHEIKHYCEKFISRGYVTVSAVKCLIIGGPTVGKTHLKHLLLIKDTPDHQVSTPIMDNPVGVLSSSSNSQGEKNNWFVIDNSLLNIIGGNIRDGITLAPSMTNLLKPLPKMNISAVLSSMTVEHGSTSVRNIHTQITSNTCYIDEIIHHICNPSDYKNISNKKMIFLIDCGGQLQYHDLYPYFIKTSTVTVFVMSQSDIMSDQPSNMNHEHDIQSIESTDPHLSDLCHKKVLHSCLEVVKSRNEMLILVGTHQDISESCENKDAQLQHFLDQMSFSVNYKDQLIQPVFSVNVKKPEDKDNKIAQLIREKIESFPGNAINMPISWLALEVVLKQSSHEGVLSLAECIKLAKSVFIDEESFSAALHLLVTNGVLLYYPEVLPHTVFCDPQVIIKKVTELIQYHNDLKSSLNDDHTVTDNRLIAFMQFGIISISILELYPMHYKDTIFTPLGLVSVLMNLGVIVKIEEDQYLMPALLPRIPITPQHNLSFMAIKFKYGCIPNGLFCGLVTYLLSPECECKWKLSMRNGRPQKLSRNCITFEGESTVDLITIVDMFSQIEVYTSNANWQKKDLQDFLHNSIKKVCNMLSFKDVECTDGIINCGLLCSGHSSNLAEVCSDSSGDSLYKKCSMENKGGYLNDVQSTWFSIFLSKKNLSPTMRPDLKMINNLPFQNWYSIGMTLGLPDHVLQGIQSNNVDDLNAQKMKMLGAWLQQDADATYMKLFHALLLNDNECGKIIPDKMDNVGPQPVHPQEPTMLSLMSQIPQHYCPVQESSQHHFVQESEFIPMLLVIICAIMFFFCFFTVLYKPINFSQNHSDL